MLFQACVLLENYNIWKMKLFLSSVLTHFDSNVTSGLHSVGWCVTLKKHHLSPFCQHPKLGSTSFQGLPYQETVSLTTPNIRRLFKIHPKYTPIRKTTGTLTSPHLHIRRHSRGVGSAHVYSRRNWSLLLRPLAPVLRATKSSHDEIRNFKAGTEEKSAPAWISMKTTLTWFKIQS